MPTTTQVLIKIVVRMSYILLQMH